jgi:prevent-host-death family protein
MYHIVHKLPNVHFDKIVLNRYMVRRLTIVEARRDFADTIGRACFGGEITVVTKHGKDVAAVVPMAQLKTPIQTPPKKPPQRSKWARQAPDP